MNIPNDISKLLNLDDHHIEDYFLCDDLVLYWDEDKRCPMAIVIEDDELAKKCFDFLKDNGCRIFDDFKDIKHEY